MITIIERGTRKEQRCKKCGCLFSYETIDVKKGNVVTSTYGMEPYKMPFKYVRCPQCNNEIILEAEK